MKKTDCYFYSEFYDMGAHIPCCTFKEYPLGKCPCDNCTNYVPQSKVSQIVSEYLEHKAIPSAEPKTGHWEWVQYDSNPNIGNWHCSECRTIIPHMPEETDNTLNYKWCPICGAKMVEEQERSE